MLDCDETKCYTEHDYNSSIYSLLTAGLSEINACNIRCEHKYISLSNLWSKILCSRYKKCHFKEM